MSVNYLTKFLAHSKCIWILAFIMVIVFIISGLPLLLLTPASITTKAAACQRPEHMFSVGCCPYSLPKLLTPVLLGPMVSITKGVFLFCFCFLAFGHTKCNLFPGTWTREELDSETQLWLYRWASCVVVGRGMEEGRLLTLASSSPQRDNSESTLLDTVSSSLILL